MKIVYSLKIILLVLIFSLAQNSFAQKGIPVQQASSSSTINIGSAPIMIQSLNACKGLCDSVNLNAYFNTWTLSNYYTGSVPGGDGWINGVNTYEDKAKANKFTVSPSYKYIEGGFIDWGAVNSTDLNLTIDVKVWNVMGGNPGTVLGSQSFSLQELKYDEDNNFFTNVVFNPPIPIPSNGQFFMGVDFSNLDWTTYKDTLSIVSNQDGQTIPSAIWEQWSDNSWHQYGTSGSWDLDASLCIFPFLTDSLPNASFTQNSTSLCPGSALTVDASASDMTALLWEFPGGTPAQSNNIIENITYSQPGTYPVKLYILGGGCNSLDSMISSVTVLAGPNADAGADQDICLGDQATLSGNGGIFYQWSNGTNNQSITVSPLATSTYTLTVTASNACSATDDVIVTVHNLPVAAAGADQDICPGEQALLAGSGGGTYLWSTGGTDAAIVVSPTSNTTYSLTVTNAYQCSATDEMVVTINPVPVADAGQDVANCWNATSTIIASGGTTYSWSNGMNGASIMVQPLTTTDFIVTVSNSYGCFDIDTARVVVDEGVPVFLGNDTSVCNYSSITLTAPAGYTYLWHDNSTTQSISINGYSGTGFEDYWVMVYDTSNCPGIDSINVYWDACTFIHNEKKQDIIIYPNPVKDILNVQLTEGAQIIEVMDLSGRILSSADVMGLRGKTLDMKTYSPGIYLLRVKRDTSTEIFKLIKE